jgi:retinol dehydrogenase-12
VTGSNTGVGKEVARILYSKHAKVYVAARSEDKSKKAIEAIKAAPQSKGELVYIPLDLSDLTTIKASTEHFLSKETKLHVLFNNAGVMTPPQGSKTAQGYELQLGTNNVGTFLFTKLLTPILISTAKTVLPSTVRVVWVSSSGAELLGEKGLGVPMDNLDYHIEKDTRYKYGVSKAGNYLHGVEFAKRYKAQGVVSIPLNPGNLNSDLTRHESTLFKLGTKTILYPPVNGAYTELFAGLSPEVKIEKSGVWGKFTGSLGRYLWLIATV